MAQISQRTNRTDLQLPAEITKFHHKRLAPSVPNSLPTFKRENCEAALFCGGVAMDWNGHESHNPTSESRLTEWG